MREISKFWVTIGFILLVNTGYTQPSANHDHSLESVTVYGPVKPGEMLWTIAARLPFDKLVNRHQVVLALLQANPQAFKNSCNLNSLKVGSILKIPSLSTVSEIDRAYAIEEIAKQAAQWQNRKTQPVNCSTLDTSRGALLQQAVTENVSPVLLVQTDPVIPKAVGDNLPEALGSNIHTILDSTYFMSFIALLIVGITIWAVIIWKLLITQLSTDKKANFNWVYSMKKILNNIVFVSITTVCGVLYIYLNSHLFFEFEDAFAQKLTLNYPIYAVQDSKGNRYVIDNSLRRISKVNTKDEVVYYISGGNREEKHFFYANEIEVDDDGYLYVLNYVADDKGFYLNREEILRFSPNGNYDGLVYRKTFSESDKKAQLIQRGEIFSLEIRHNVLSWFNLTSEGITQYNYHIQYNEIKKVSYYPLAEANIVVGDITQLSAGNFVYSSKDGLITQVQLDGSSRVLFSAEKAKAKSGDFIVPWEIGTDASGQIYFIDLEGKNVRTIVSPAETKILLDQSIIESQQEIQIKAFNYYRLSVNLDGTLITCNDEAVVTQMSTGTISYLTSANLPLTWQLEIFIFGGIGLILIFLIIWEIRLIYTDVLKRNVPNILKLSIGIVIIVTLVTFLSSYYFITNFSGRYQQVVFEKISQVIQLVPKVLDGNRIERIKEQSDFNNQDYKYVYGTLYNALNKNQDYWNEGYYFALYRVINDRLYGFMYTDGRINMYYPFDWLGDGGVYDQALAGKIATEAATDITGDWIYGVGPVTNKEGKVIALLEIGTDLYYLRMENERLIKELVLNLAIVLIILILLLVEISYISELHKQKYQKILDECQYFSEVMLIRPLSFLYFTAVSVSVTFIPLLMKKFYEPIPGFSQEMVLAMPLSLEMFFFGIGTTIAGIISSR
ncbi:MAG: hypothetical protein BWK79_14800, partial [Beggiatoa sp. IS2]